jgi:hypothetical protein
MAGILVGVRKGGEMAGIGASCASFEGYAGVVRSVGKQGVSEEKARVM